MGTFGPSFFKIGGILSPDEWDFQQVVGYHDTYWRYFWEPGSCVLHDWNKIKSGSSLFAQSTAIEGLIFSFGASTNPLACQRDESHPNIQATKEKGERALVNIFQMGPVPVVTRWLFLDEGRGEGGEEKKGKETYLK